MIKIDMDNGKRYTFAKEHYDDYEIRDTVFIIFKDEQIVGFFEMSHMIGFFVDK